MELQYEWNPDFLGLSRIDRVRVLEQDEKLYVQHRLDASKPPAQYDNKALVQFANAHSPTSLVEFIEEHGYLFNVDEEKEHLPKREAIAPQVATVQKAFAPFHWSQKKKRAITQAANKLQLECLKLDAPEEWFSSGLQAPIEHLGDWLAARGLLLAALELLEKTPTEREGTPCPPFTVSFDDAPRYSAFLQKRIHAETVMTHSANGTEEHRQGFVLEHDRFSYIPGISSRSIATVLDMLVEYHLNMLHLACKGLVLHVQFDNLLQAMWYQLAEQAGKSFIVRRCDNCSSLMTSTPGGFNKRACCASCEQALKERRTKGR